MMQDLGERLRALRDARRLTQQQLADRSGIEREKIAKIETGTRRMTGTEVIYLAESLDVQPHDLIGVERGRSYYRGSGNLNASEAQAMSIWFEEYIEDALFLDRTADRYDVE
jgi:transcriptional regulator with XRE-family HTH domain